MTTVLIVVFSLVAFIAGFIVRWLYARTKARSAEMMSKTLIDEARRTADAEKKSLLVETRDLISRERNTFENEVRERRSELSQLEKRIHQKEENLDRKYESIDQREHELANREKRNQQQEAELSTAMEKHRKELERISGLSAEEAKRALISALEEEAKRAASRTIDNIEKGAIEAGEKKAREVIIQAIQRIAGEVTQDASVSSVSLPGEEMKGRIIGREGRNIRTLETLTGVDVIIDDTPEAVIISCFDPVRREVAKRSLEKLVLDGRIHPARIEEVVERTTKEIEHVMMEEGERARIDMNITSVHPEILRYVGRLHFRTSYGQNVLAHIKEVSNISGIIAAELGANVELARRGGFLHDIGKAVEVEGEGSHSIVGAEMAKRFGEPETIVNIIRAHHGDVDALSPEAVIVKAADAISAARPGARRESFENYVKRLENLERIANSFAGVEKTFAIQAGREIRVMARNDMVDDAKAKDLARDIARKIEEELKYPGIIRVTVIREMRAVEIAR
ncbi:MAG: ribonuclease Y [Spirochaetota bacterium]